MRQHTLEPVKCAALTILYNYHEETLIGVWYSRPMLFDLQCQWAVCVVVHAVSCLL